jgi:glutathione S-transferase
VDRASRKELSFEYLDERYPTPPLIPTDAAVRATVGQWMGWNTHYWPSAWKASGRVLRDGVSDCARDRRCATR